MGYLSKETGIQATHDEKEAYYNEGQIKSRALEVCRAFDHYLTAIAFIESGLLLFKTYSVEYWNGKEIRKYDGYVAAANFESAGHPYLKIEDLQITKDVVESWISGMDISRWLNKANELGIYDWAAK
jgi:hypothetical protein